MLCLVMCMSAANCRISLQIIPTNIESLKRFFNQNCFNTSSWAILVQLLRLSIVNSCMFLWGHEIGHGLPLHHLSRSTLVVMYLSGVKSDKVKLLGTTCMIDHLINARRNSYSSFTLNWRFFPERLRGLISISPLGLLRNNLWELREVPFLLSESFCLLGVEVLSLRLVWQVVRALELLQDSR